MDFFRLYECCIVVKGNQRSVVCDVQRGDAFFIPNFLAEVLQKHDRGINIKFLKSDYSHENQEIINDYFDFLISKEIGFFCEESELERFPKLNLKWESPIEITNVIIDIESEVSYLYKFLKQLEYTGCQYVQIRFFYSLDFKLIKQIITDITNLKLFSSLYILVRNCLSTSHDKYRELMEEFPLVEELHIHDVKKEIIPKTKKEGLFYYESKFSKLNCGIVNNKMFITNFDLLKESQHHNTCLNRKISIDAEGNIKNCPSMKESYGNIKDTTLREALEKPGFKKYWNINKDQIEVCKDCEFRYICTDCRAYLEDPENIYSKPLKCGYNPYTCVWEEWSTNPLKQKAIEYYSMEDLVKSEV